HFRHGQRSQSCGGVVRALQDAPKLRSGNQDVGKPELYRAHVSPRRGTLARSAEHHGRLEISRVNFPTGSWSEIHGTSSAPWGRDGRVGATTMNSALLQNLMAGAGSSSQFIGGVGVGVFEFVDGLLWE